MVCPLGCRQVFWTWDVQVQPPRPDRPDDWHLAALTGRRHIPPSSMTKQKLLDYLDFIYIVSFPLNQFLSFSILVIARLSVSIVKRTLSPGFTLLSREVGVTL